jgi:hypothetical protein
MPPAGVTPSAEQRERRLDLLRKDPAVIVRKRQPEALGPFVPSVRVIEGSMSLEDFLHLLGRRDDDDQLSGAGDHS